MVHCFIRYLDAPPRNVPTGYIYKVLRLLGDILPHQYPVVEISGTAFHLVGTLVCVPTVATMATLLPTWDDAQTCGNIGIRALSATVEDLMTSSSTSSTLVGSFPLDHLKRYSCCQLSEIGMYYRLSCYVNVQRWTSCRNYPNTETSCLTMGRTSPVQRCFTLPSPSDRLISLY